MLTHKSLANFRNFVVTVLALVCCSGLVVLRGQNSSTSKDGRDRKSVDQVVPYVPTPPDVVEKMLELAHVTSNDVVYDLGSGDGRIVIMAAQKFGAHAVGIELDPKLYEESSKKIEELKLEKQAKIIHDDMFESNFHPATVVTLYLLTLVNERLRPVLEKQLRPGTRVVSHDFEIHGWKPEKVVQVTSSNGLSHTLYLYIR